MLFLLLFYSVFCGLEPGGHQQGGAAGCSGDTQQDRVKFANDGDSFRGFSVYNSLINHLKRDSRQGHSQEEPRPESEEPENHRLLLLLLFLSCIEHFKLKVQ